jgi:hypothetical protein
MSAEYEIEAGGLAEYSSWSELRNAVESNEGLVVTTMEKLRYMKGAGRLGKHVRDAISKDLAANGLGHLPPVLPEYQERRVRIYSLGSNISDVVNAVYSPSPDGDLVLREIGSSKPQALVQQIRELVCG